MDATSTAPPRQPASTIDRNTSATDKTFTIHTSLLPSDTSDTPILQSVFTRSFGSKSLAGSALANASKGQNGPSEDLAAFSARVRSIRQQNTLEGRNSDHQRSVVGKVVHDQSGEVVGCVTLLAPASKISSESSDAVLDEIPLRSAASASGIPAGGEGIVDMWARSDVQIERRSAELLGHNWKQEWWSLTALAVVPEFQRLGLGGRLVRWAIERVRDDVEQRRRQNDFIAIEGLCLVAAQGAIGTYAREGLKVIGEGWLGGDEDDGKHKDGEEGKEKDQGRKFTWMTLDM